VFSQHEQSLRNQSLIKKILKLTPEEDAELKVILSRIDPTQNINYEKERRALSLGLLSGDKTKSLDMEKIFKFAETSPLFKSVCEDRLLPHNKSWSAALQKKEHLYFEIKSLDTSDSVSISSLCLGEFCMYKYREAENTTPKIAFLSTFWLDQACKLGVFHALTTRLKDTVDEIKRNQSLPMDSTGFENDLNRVADLYGTMGQLHAARIYLDVGLFLKNADYQKKAALHFLCGKILLENKDIHQTNRVFTILTKNKGLDAFNYSNWTDAENQFLTPIADQAKSLESQAQKIIHDKIQLRLGMKR